MPETSAYYHLAYTLALGVYAVYGLSLQLHGARRPVLRTRRDQIYGRRDARLRVPLVDDAQSAASFLDATALRVPGGESRSRCVSRHAGKATFRAGSWSCAASWTGA